jgi:SsrA-binding protein
VAIMAKKPQQSEDGRRIVAKNRKASHNYHLIESMEVGIVLQGTEVKSLRAGKCSIVEAFARITPRNEIQVVGMHIAEYADGTYNNHQTLRTRKLLLKRAEINRLVRKLKAGNLTLVPTLLYFNARGIAKLTLCLAQGKKEHDKRHDLKKKQHEREMSRHRIR